MLQIVCPNTSIDVRIELDHFSHGQVQRATKTKGFASGKGVNSAFTSDFLGIEAGLHAMVGALDKDYFDTCTFSNIETFLSAFPGETRRNLTIVDHQGLVAHIQTTGFTVSDENVQDFISRVSEQVNSGDVVLIAGSLPSGFHAGRLYELIRAIKQSGTTIILDTDLYRIDDSEDLEIDFVKPNIEELHSYLKKHDIANVTEGFARLRSLGVKHTIVTCGSQGSFLFDHTSHSTLFAQSSFENLGSEAIGSGDAFIGAFAASLACQEDHIEALRKATAAGHSNIFHEGPGRIGNTFLEIQEKTQVTYIDRKVAIDRVSKILSA